MTASVRFVAGLPASRVRLCGHRCSLLMGAMAPSALPAANLGAVVSYQKTGHGITRTHRHG